MNSRALVLSLEDKFQDIGVAASRREFYWRLKKQPTWIKLKLEETPMLCITGSPEVEIYPNRLHFLLDSILDERGYFPSK